MGAEGGEDLGCRLAEGLAHPVLDGAVRRAGTVIQYVDAPPELPEEVTAWELLPFVFECI